MGHLRKLGMLLAMVAALVHGALPAPAQQPAPLDVRQYAPLVMEGTYAPMSLALREQLRWFNPSLPTRSYDVVLIADYSGSMRECYSNTTTCSAPNRRIDYQTPVLRRFVKEMLVTRNSQGLDNKVAFVTFGHSENGLNVARTHVTFTTTNQVALERYAALIGTNDSPRTIPNSEVTGASASAAGFQAAKELFAASRTIDAYGRPVARAVLFLNDGVPSVFVDPPLAGLQNRADLNPFRCQSTIPGQLGTDDPMTQYLCPAENHPANTAGVRPPLRAVVEIADEIRALYGAQIYTILMGSPNGMILSDLRLPVIAAEGSFYAANPSQLDVMSAFITQRLGQPCQEFAAAARPAAGAQVELINSGGTRVYSGTTDANGMITERLAPGTYTLRASKTGLIAPNDPTHTPYAYGRLMTDLTAGPSPTALISVTLPLSGASFPKRALLTLTNPGDATCQQR